jgi:hypothetical protein
MVSRASIPPQFDEDFAADLSVEQAAFMARSQVPNAADNFKAVITTHAWREKSSWMVVAGRIERSTPTSNDGSVPHCLHVNSPRTLAPHSQTSLLG